MEETSWCDVCEWKILKEKERRIRLYEVSLVINNGDDRQRRCVVSITTDPCKCDNNKEGERIIFAVIMK
jgi:hypothetical protein